MSDRYEKSSERLLRATRVDNKEEVEVILTFSDTQHDEDDESLFTLCYSVESNDDQTSLVSGVPNGASYRELIKAAFDERVEGFSLLIYTNMFPQRSRGASSRNEIDIYIQLDGPMGFRDFIKDVANEFPCDEQETKPLITDDGPSKKDTIN